MEKLKKIEKIRNITSARFPGDNYITMGEVPDVFLILLEVKPHPERRCYVQKT